MAEIHPSALIGRNVEMGVGNSVGPNTVIEDGVRLGSHNTILAGVHLSAGTEIGSHNQIHMHAVIGHTPQDLAYKGGPSFTKIGSHNVIREFVTIHRGTKPGSATVLGDSNYLMAYAHVAHNCEIGSRVMMVNQASLTGYCVVEDGAFLSGMTGFHQFTRIGRLAMVSALSAANKDIPPFMTCGGRPAVVVGVNAVGMKRAGIPAPVREEIKQAYKLLYRSGLNVSQAAAHIRRNFSSPEIRHLLAFIESSKRGILDGAADAEETLKPRKT